MEIKRFQKIDTFLKTEFQGEFCGFDVIRPNAKKFFLTYGIHKVMLEGYLQSASQVEGVVEDETKSDRDWGIICVTVLQPLAPGLMDFLKTRAENGLEKILFVEQSISGQFESLIRTQMNFRADFPTVEFASFRSTSLFPIFEESI
jgi:hypothetical protein